MYTTHHSQRQSVGINVCSVSGAPNDTVRHAVDDGRPQVRSEVRRRKDAYN
jgi:hypothetical protein